MITFPRFTPLVDRLIRAGVRSISKSDYGWSLNVAPDFQPDMMEWLALTLAPLSFTNAYKRTVRCGELELIGVFIMMRPEFHERQDWEVSVDHIRWQGRDILDEQEIL
jgi:hypothetical protein